jgi:mono/diheme cytochrome c family protein
VLPRQDPDAQHDRLPDAEAAFLAALHREAEEARRAVFGPVLEDAPQAGGATPGAGLARGRGSTGGCAGCHGCRSPASPAG